MLRITPRSLSYLSLGDLPSLLTGLVAKDPTTVGGAYFKISNVHSAKEGNETWRRVGQMGVSEVDFDYLKDVNREVANTAIYGKVVYRVDVVIMGGVHSVKGWSKRGFRTVEVL